MTKYFGYKYLVNWPMIIEIYENALGYFYCLLHTVRVKNLTWIQPIVNIGAHAQVYKITRKRQQHIFITQLCF